MDDCGCNRCEGLIPTVRKKRSQRRRRIVSPTFPEFLHHDKYADDANAGGRSHNLNYSISRDYSSIKKKEDGGSTATYSNARRGDDTNPRHGMSLRQSGNAREGVANDSKMKLKVGEVRGAIQTKNSFYGSSSLFSSESARPSDASEPRQNLTPQDNSSIHGPPADGKSGSNRISCKDFPRGTFGASKSGLAKVRRRNVFEKQGDKPHQNRKSQRVPRRLVLDELDEDEYADDANVGERIYNLNYSISRDSSANRFKGDYSSTKKKEDGGSTMTYSNARGGDDMNPGHGTSLRQSGNAGEGVANDRKMKLKVGEVRGAIQTKNSSYGSSSLFSSESTRPSDVSEPRQNLTPQENSSVHGPPADEKSGSNRISCEDFPGGTFGARKSDLEKVPRRNVFEKQGDKPHQNRKSQRVPRRLVLDELDEDEYVDDANVGGRIYNLNYSISTDSSANRFKGDYSSIKKKEDGGSTATYSNARGGDDIPGHGTSLRQSGNAGEGVANDSKMKLKVGEVRGAIQTKNSFYGSSSLFSSESARPSDASEPRQNLTPQDNSSVHDPPADKKSGSNRISCEDFPVGTFGSSKSDLEKVPRRNVFEKQGDKPHQDRKSQRVPRRLILDELDEDEYADDANVGGRIYNLNYSISRDSSANRFKGDYSSIKKKEDGGSTMTYSNARGGDDMNPRHGTSLRQSGNVGEGVANDSKMNLKVGEVRHASQIKNSSYGSSSSLFSSESARPSDASDPRQNLAPQDNSSVHGPPADEKSGSNRISCEDFPRGTFGASKSDLEKVPRRNVFEKQGDKPHENRKSQRVPRRLVLDELDEDEYADDANVRGRIYNLNYSISTDSSANRFKGVYSSINKEDGGSTATYSNARGGDDMNPGHGTSLRQSGNAGEGVANDSKMKLKVGEVRGAIQTKNSSYGSSSLFSSESARPSDASEPRQNLTPQDNSSVHGPPADEKSGSNRISCKDFPGGTFGASKSDLEKVPRRNVFEKQGDKPHENRKSQRVPRRLVLDELDEDEYADDANVGGRIYNLNYSIFGDSFANRFKGVYSSVNKKEDGGSTATYSNARSGDDMNPGHGTSLRQSGNTGEGVANDSKMMLKVGEVRGAIQTKNSSYGSSSLFSSESARPSDASEPRQNLTPQDNPSEHGPLADKKSGSKGISCEDFPGGTFGASKSDLDKMPMKNVFEKHGDKPHQNRKRQRVPRRLVLDGLDEDDDDDEIHYLVKLNTSKVAGYKDLGEGSTKTSGVLKVDKYDLENIGRSGKEVKRISHRGSEEELLSDGEAKWTKKEKQMKESSETPVETKSEINLTARQRALLSRRDSSATSVNQIEFPNGLPPAPPRKQKEKLSEVEQQLKKAEAARKRRIQYEKAARESEAEAIRKILGHDRKKREEETKKQQEELAQKRVAKELASNTIRTVIGPAGTTVTFSHDIGLPSIFDSKPCSYPPPREKCAGPSCVNTYKYRDSKSNLPLCSLKCYKAIHEKMQDEKPC